MIDVTLSWTDFKAEMITRNTPIKYYRARDGFYYIIFQVDSIQFSCRIDMDGNDDQIDFETNYKDQP